jgi:hypothetical protein
MTHVKWMLPALVAVGLCAGSAAAQETMPKATADAPKKAVEIGLGMGYSQGAGYVVESGERVSDIAGPGGEAALDVGWRFNERWLVGGYSSFGYFNTPDGVGNDVTVRGVSAGAQGQYHIRPFGRWDPWVGFGIGYRGLYSAPNDGPVDSRHGIQLARIRIGVDIRPTRSFALGPVLGFDATMFTGTHSAGTSFTSRIGREDLAISPFVFFGVQGRFDFGKERVSSGERQLASVL